MISYMSDIFVLPHFRGQEIKVSIDDFGNGYSSLSAMQDLAVNTVKIDRPFIQSKDET